MKLKLC